VGEIEVTAVATQSAVARPLLGAPAVALPEPSPLAVPRPAGTAESHGETIRRRDALHRRSLAAADMLAVGIALVASALLLGNDQITPWALLVPPGFIVLVKGLGLYDRDEHLLHRSTLDEVPALFSLATLAAILLWLSDGAIVEGGLGRRQILGTWILLFVLLVCLRTLARRVARGFSPVERCLLLGESSEARYLADKLSLTPTTKAELVGSMPLSATTGERDEPGLHEGLGPILTAHSIDRVIVASGARGRDELLYIIRALKAHGVKVSVLPEASRVAGSSVELDHLHGVTLLGMRRFDFPRSSRLIKRLFDVLGAALGLLVLSPVLIASALAIRIDTPGPLIFRQRRVGRNGERFEILKFRSMVIGAEHAKDEIAHLNEGASGLFKIADDPRVTRVGRVLRRFQIDELPQLLNVLRGEMSLVGPRPLIPEEDRRIVGWYRRRLDVPPGITGHWQVLGSSRQISIEEMVKLDYLYVANWSLWSDVQLLLRTLGFLASRRGI
jgi:exopolysaccharide biosynthesis polyprenyl glycosylphosphotransferase